MNINYGPPNKKIGCIFMLHNVKYFPNSYPIYLVENKSIIFSKNLDCCFARMAALCPKTVPMMRNMK